MKIAYVYDAIYPYQIGGVEKRIFELSKRLAARGHEIHLYGLKTWNGDPTFFRDGVWYHGVGDRRSFYHKRRRSVSEAVYFGLCVLNPLLREDFDIIDCQNFPYFSCISSAIASQVKKSHLVITWHEVWGDYWYEYMGPWGSIGKLVEKIIDGFSRNSIAVSGMTQGDLKKLNRHQMAATIIPNGVDYNVITRVQPSDYHADIVYCGRLTREKNLFLLLEALLIIKQSKPDIRCTIIGRGPDKSLLNTFIATHNLSENIVFQDFAPDYEAFIALLKSSGVFASPSLREGFGIAALEALACGIPVVTVDSPKNSVKELIYEKTGIVSSVSPDTFAGSIAACLLTGGSMKNDCSNFARQYDWDSVVDLTEKYYSKIIEE